MASVSDGDAHQRTLVTLISGLQAITQDMNGELRSAPAAIYIDPQHKVKPDAFWISGDNDRCYLDDNDHWVGAPNLIIEILSPETEAHDRGNKFRIYEANRVLEYWLVNPVSEFVESYVLLKKRLTRHGLYQPGESFSSGVLNGRKIDVAPLFGHATTD